MPADAPFRRSFSQDGTGKSYERGECCLFDGHAYEVERVDAKGRVHLVRLRRVSPGPVAHSESVVGWRTALAVLAPALLVGCAFAALASVVG